MSLVIHIFIYRYKQQGSNEASYNKHPVYPGKRAPNWLSIRQNRILPNISMVGSRTKTDTFLLKHRGEEAYTGSAL